jgi:hypothetical protein
VKPESVAQGSIFDSDPPSAPPPRKLAAVGLGLTVTFNKTIRDKTLTTSSGP